MSEWISVEEKLPKLNGNESDKILICDDGDITTGTFYKYKETPGFFSDDYFELAGATHWMPLPPPPNSFEDICSKKHPAT